MAAFALGRVAGGASEYFDHSDFGQPMDMRIPVDQCAALTPPVTETKPPAPARKASKGKARKAEAKSEA